MSSYYFSGGLRRGSLCLLACLAVGCGPDAAFTQLPIVPADELSQLPTDCEPLLNVADEDLAWARAAGDDAAIVLDAPEGSCVAQRESVLMTLSDYQREELVARIVHDFTAGDPAPHPDLNSQRPAGADPSPHPDKPQGNASADPAPHPDKGESDDADDLYKLLVAVGLLPGDAAPSGGGTPAPPPPPVPAQSE